MKKISILKMTTIISTICVLLVLLSSCYSSEMISYYSQKENYISVTGTVSYMKYNEDNTALYIGFDELSPVLDDTCFKIVGENIKIVKANRIEDKLKMGERISFITAPKYYGDGYVMPIVSISINGDEVLDFEEGYENFMDWLVKN